MASTPQPEIERVERGTSSPEPVKLTVTGLFRPGWHAFPLREQVPLLQLVGPWLERAGFFPGAQVTVRVQQGRLVVVLRNRDEGACDGEGC